MKAQRKSIRHMNSPASASSPGDQSSSNRLDSSRESLPVIKWENPDLLSNSKKLKKSINKVVTRSQIKTDKRKLKFKGKSGKKFPTIIVA